MKKILLYLFILSSIVWVAPSSYADYQGTIGTRFTIGGESFGYSKSKVYLLNGNKKLQAKVESWSDSSITCLWTKKISPGTYPIFVQPKGKGVPPISAGNFTIMQPIIDEITPNNGIAGDTITINGWYFTNKKPKVYFEDPNTNKRKSCKVISFSMDPQTGSSTLQLVIPKWGLENYNLILITTIGQATVKFPFQGNKTSISGTVAPPVGINPSSLTIVALGNESTISTGGNFAAEVYNEGVTIVSAMLENKEFGLLNVIAAFAPSTSSSKLTEKKIKIAAAFKSETSDSIELNAKTTAVSMVFITPYFFTNDPQKAANLIQIIQNDSKVNDLANIIISVFNDANPLENPLLQQSLNDAIKSVLTTIQNKAQTTNSFNKSTDQLNSVIFLPEKSHDLSLSAMAAEETQYSIDLNQIKLNISLQSNTYRVDIDSKEGSGVDWLGEIGALNSNQFSSINALQENANNKNNIYERESTLGRERVSAKSALRWLDIFGTLTDVAFDAVTDFLSPDGIYLPSDVSKVYILRSFSGGGWQADSAERNVIGNLPNGSLDDKRALVSNIVSAAIDLSSVIIDVNELSPGQETKDCYVDHIQNTIDATIGQSLSVTTTTDWLLLVPKIAKEFTMDLANCMFKEASKNLFKFIGNLILKSAEDAVEIASGYELLKIGADLGMIMDRGNQLIFYATPVESAFIVVGNPFPATPSTYSISGQVTLNGSGLSGVTISLTGAVPTTTDSGGNYIFTGLQSGSYTVTPSKTGYSFTPASPQVTINNANATQNFTAALIPPSTYSITGQVTYNGSGLSGVTVSLTGAASNSKTTDVNGNYTFDGLQNGLYTITPSKTGYSFTPASPQVTINNANATQNFTAALIPPSTSSISGQVTYNGSGLSGVTVSLTGAASNSKTTDVNGNYTFDGLQSGLYTITPSKTGYIFTPASPQVTINNANATQNFTAALIPPSTYSISGQVTLNGSGLSGVTITLTGTGSTSTITNSNGNYTFAGAQNGSYTVTPSMTGYTFTPANQAVTINGANATVSNFIASAVPEAHGSINLPQTGQTTCYDTSGNVIPCSGTGQDGAIQAGVAWPNPRFSNTDGTAPISGDIVLDKLTGLQWTKNGGTPTVGSCTGGAMKWLAALDYVACLNSNNYLGHNDWRLPNINELESLVNAGQAPAAWLNTQGFSSAQSNYWSSTMGARGTGTGSAWFVAMWCGYTQYSTSADYSYYVWPVRGGQCGLDPSVICLSKTGQTTSYAAGDDGAVQWGVAWPSPRFADNGDQTITDNLAGLVWSKDAGTPTVGSCTGGAMIWQSALDYVACLNTGNYLGHKDWRLPNRKELQSLVDYSQSYDALPVGHPFTNLQSYYYWSSTSFYLSSASYGGPSAWIMTRWYGTVSYYPKASTNSSYVWPVRGGQSGSFGSISVP